MSTKVSNKEKLLAKQDRIREDKQRVESRILALQNQIKDEDRKARTHRLCTRGGMLESFLPDPENITDGTVIRPHDLRHSFCEWCITNGVDVKTVSSWMGHSDQKMIMRIYDHVTEKREMNAAEKLNKLFCKETDSDDQNG